VRGVAQECDVKSTKLVDVMSTNVRCAKEDQDVDEILGEMADTQIRRMPVVDSQQRLVGIVSLGDIADKDPENQEDVGVSLGDISSPAQPDRSGQSQASGAAGGGSSAGGSSRRS
jgi:CBS-domain-containing membrane protein